ncbi:hypothetical protein AUK40_02815 [Candidatus Wirthbacteria bacterium CG2_30_54_11]|uniref:Soluble ligand binding domain-containing protein n=1 Tax=Candidatus Wirthbacteria bacterium CG2_30_54_11 TaxID=1817892 RepID=A0A1J5IWP1_9BACT|nr:MAG: hypothetical protein AUK40_02815 [Candidatus Wirthbacteria bacterium CG2_30_54_11]
MNPHWFDRTAPWVGLALIVAIISGGVILWQRGGASPEIRINQTDSAADLVMVDVEGAVVSPGVYSLSTTARIEDAIRSAGGLREDADMDHFLLSRASLLQDGQLIRIPVKGETAASTSGTTDTALAGTCVNLNLASQTELDTLNGIGPVYAKKIIDNRPYTQITDLVTKKVISQSIFNGLSDKICI